MTDQMSRNEVGWRDKYVLALNCISKNHNWHRIDDIEQEVTK